ncbi:hypothetical protein I2494_18525 [Budviciaceae bacterium BWR-B9]|uniref:Uncharacterized protein n=1 Tax=Limnobaculum allomyrinae TaxID=2791986 RepID=A0ABS1IV99_9GAMM|nr:MULTISPECIES: hypothetical protein [Limnobaculum]MBK5145673.1 hypothetical protein [Limnobaculum allomyrinae]MBV7692618.1 hypothetical protein [Limnobaculum sp. M2-1]
MKNIILLVNPLTFLRILLKTLITGLLVITTGTAFAATEQPDKIQQSAVQKSSMDRGLMFQQAVGSDLAGRHIEARKLYDALKGTDLDEQISVPSAINLAAIEQFNASLKEFDGLALSRDTRVSDYAHLWQLWLTARMYTGENSALKKKLNNMASGMRMSSPTQQAIVRLYSGDGDVYDNSTHTGGTKITNVADGTAPSDAVNFSQLTETNDTVNNIYNSGTKYFHANSTGADSSATGKDSVAIGMGAVASHDNSIALGAGSVANGSTLNNAAYLVGGTATSEVNIGGRRITGVSAGAMDDDAVNVAQLKAVSNMASGTDERALKYNWVDKNGDGIVQPDEVDYSKATLAGDNGTVISNLAVGEVSATSTEAINGSQLYNVAGDTSVTYTTNNGSGVRYVRTNATGLPESDAFAKGKASTAVGYNATSTGESSVAIGQDSSASALSSIAIGKGAEADTERSVAWR